MRRSRAHAARSFFVAGGVVEEAGQLDFEHARVHAFEDGDHAFQHHLAALLSVADADAHLAGEGQEEEIGDAHAVDGGDKGDGDAAAHLLNVVQMLHDLNQPQHRAENADGGREASGRLEDRGQPLFALRGGVQADAHDLAQLGGLGAVHGQHQGLLEEGILNGLQVGVQRDDAVAAGLVGEGDQQADELVVVLARRGKDVRQAAECGHHRGERKLEQHRAQGAAKDDQGRGGLQDLAQVAAFDQQPGNNAGNGQEDSADARFIHEQLLEKYVQKHARSAMAHSFSDRVADRVWAALAAGLDWPERSRLASETTRCRFAKGGQPPGHRGQQARPVGEHPLHHLGAVLAHNQLFSIDEREHGVGRGLGGLDQVAVQHHRSAVEPGKFDHGHETPLR